MMAKRRTCACTIIQSCIIRIKYIHCSGTSSFTSVLVEQCDRIEVESLSLCRCSVAPREVGEGLEVCELATGLRVVQLDEAAVAEQGGALCGEGVIAGHPHWLTPTTHTAQTPLVSAQQEREREREKFTQRSSVAKDKLLYIIIVPSLLVLRHRFRWNDFSV